MRLLTLLPIGAISMAAVILGAVQDGFSLVEGAAAVVMVVAMIRQTLLLGDQTAVLARERQASERERQLREGAQQALAARETSEARYRTLVDVFKRLSDDTTFAADEGEMFKAAGAALARLAPCPGGAILSTNASADRLAVVLAWGELADLAGSDPEPVPPDGCLGIRRGTPFVVEDAADPWAPACPAHPIGHGSTMCVPMIAAGKIIGVIHLARNEPRSFDEDDRRQASRIAEQVALAVSNTRLIRTMEGLALTDGLTGLHNARFFDPFLDRELAQAERDGSPVGLIAIDLDHFKQFNDTHGHPAGDEALRAFARGCLGVLRRSDTMARIGGEEFSVAIRRGQRRRRAAQGRGRGAGREPGDRREDPRRDRAPDGGNRAEPLRPDHGIPRRCQQPVSRHRSQAIAQIRGPGPLRGEASGSQRRRRRGTPAVVWGPAPGSCRPWRG